MKKNRLQKVGLLVLFTLFVTISINAQKKRIGIIGSSTPACSGVPSDSCYSALLDNYYTNTLQATTPMQLFAIGGFNLYQAMPLDYVPPGGRPAPHPWVSITTAIQANWGLDVILVNFPSTNYNIWTTAEVMNCLRIIKQTANAAGKLCFIATTQPRHNNPDFDDQLERDKLIELKDLILNEFGQYAIDFWSGIANVDGTIKAEYEQPDHVHLNGAGHAILLDRVIQRNILLDPALPLYNLNFKSEYKNEKVVLTWKNEPDNQIESFQLQKSRDGRSFSTIYDVKSTPSNAYSYTDQKPDQGNNFYRLLAFFKSGKKDYSQVLKQAIRNGSFNIDRVFKTSQGVQVEWQSRTQQTYSIKLFNSMGSLVGSSEYRAVPGSNRYILSLPAIAKGSYFMIVENKTGEKEVRTLMIPN